MNPLTNHIFAKAEKHGLYDYNVIKLINDNWSTAIIYIAIALPRYKPTMNNPIDEYWAALASVDVSFASL